MPAKIPVSVAIITKNEERDLERALQSVSDFAEIIVVDSFSSDNTISIAQQYTHRVFQHEWPGFALQKQRAIDYAACDWVLILDADEKLSPELCNEIAEAIHDTRYQGYYLPRKNFFLGKWIKYSGLGQDYTLRLFKKSAGQMELREVHEKVLVKGNTAKLVHFLEHYSHADLADYLTKTHYYADLAAAQMAKEERKVYWYTLFIKPWFAFIKLYILKQGFRDGLPGFILAKLFSFSTFLKYAKLWEKYHQK